MQMSPIRLYCINGMVELLTALKPRRRLFITSSRKWFYKKYYTIRTNKCRFLIIIDGYHLPIPHENHIEVSQKHWLRHVQEREKHAKKTERRNQQAYTSIFNKYPLCLFKSMSVDPEQFVNVLSVTCCHVLWFMCNVQCSPFIMIKCICMLRCFSEWDVRRRTF